MGGTHFLQTGYLLLNRNAPDIINFMALLLRHYIIDKQPFQFCQQK